MAHDTIAIANCILEIAEEHEQPITQMKLQKLVYFMHGWHLGLGQGSLCDEEVEAWRWGPVFPALYQAAKEWGSAPIKGRLTNFRLHGIDGRIRAVSVAPHIDQARNSFVFLLARRVWEIYGHMTAAQLSSLTHQQGTPWHQVVNDPRSGDVIPNDLIRSFFEEKARVSA